MPRTKSNTHASPTEVKSTSSNPQSFKDWAIIIGPEDANEAIFKADCTKLDGGKGKFASPHVYRAESTKDQFEWLKRQPWCELVIWDVYVPLKERPDDGDDEGDWLFD